MTEIEKTVKELEVCKDAGLDVPDSRTGLTNRERLAVLKTWKEGLKLGKVEVGMVLFNMYFDRHPEYITLFRAFKDIDRETLRTHARLKAHALTVIQALDGTIENLEDSETSVLMLEKTGRDHVRRKLKAKQFEDLQATVLALLESVLGGAWTPFVAKSWDTALTVVMSVVVNSMKQEQIAQGIPPE